MGFSEGQLVACATTSRISASLTVLGSILIILFIWLFNMHRGSIHARLVLWLAITALLGTPAHFIADAPLDSHGNVVHDELCTFQAFWGSFWDWAIILWIVVIAFNLWLVIVWDAPEDTSKLLRGWLEFLYHCFVWIPASVFAIIPLAADRYGAAGGWCWIDDDSQVLRLFMLYIPLFGLFILVFLLYAWMGKRVYSMPQVMGKPDAELERKRKRQIFWRLSAYPFIFLFVWIFSIINRIHDFITDDELFGLAYLQCLFMPLQGAINALAFAFDRELVSRLNRAELSQAVKNKLCCASAARRGQQMQEFPMRVMDDEEEDEGHAALEANDVGIDEMTDMEGSEDDGDGHSDDGAASDDALSVTAKSPLRASNGSSKVKVVWSGSDNSSTTT